MNRKAFYIAAAVIVAAAVLAGRFWLVPQQAGTQQVSQAPGVPRIGGPFTLVDQDGREVTDETYRGKFMLVYFGYTFCPDICPTSLTAITETLSILGPAADKIVPIFISVDPERDRPEYMKDYLQYFDTRFRGLTGTPDQVMSVAKAYRVYYIKMDKEGADPDDYLIDHTSNTYIMGPDGRFQAHFGHGTSPGEMAARIRELL